MASTRRPGDLAALGFASRLILFAGALIAIPIGTMIFPHLSRHAAARDRDALISTIRRTTGLVLAGSVPVAAAFVFFAGPIVGVAFERGAFGEHGRNVTAGVLAAYGFGLSAICVNEILVRALFALEQQRVVAILWTSALAVNIALNFPLIHLYGVSGLGVGASIGVWLNLLCMATWLAMVLRREARA
jgi:putative peptidoglycan lipid II flippase